MQPTHEIESARRVGFPREELLDNEGPRSPVSCLAAAKASGELISGDNRARRDRQVLSVRLGLVIILFAYAVGAWLTWRKWPDLLVDFGAQLYLPWRISEGSVLYRDVMYLTGGPLSQYYHAALFKVFGVSFLTLIVSNLAIGLGLWVLM